ncbi:MAG TPA: chemotaxis protein CheC [Candidatus Omnitrophota bacterium]|nr:chemotaxis protein CheC [Candidatus Omnitrophota bacterium]HQJ15073.1 chemotaxis protein CheC [Candidatus Omnitrophota bacterium]
MENIALNSDQLDVLREIGTIGSGSAATALSQLLGKRVSIAVPQVSLFSGDQMSPAAFSMKSEDIGLAVDLKILGALRGGMLALYSQQSALMMIDILMKRPAGTTQLLNLLEASALSESSHILAGAYLNAVAQMLELHNMMLSIPQTIVDRMDRLNILLGRRLSEGGVNYLLPIENKMVIEETEIDLFVVFLLELDSVNKMLKIVGL